MILQYFTKFTSEYQMLDGDYGQLWWFFTIVSPNLHNEHHRQTYQDSLQKHHTRNICQMTDDFYENGHTGD